ncbi:MAG TPA: Re/Si-specific NAD(P)(+) transhydrogenase subunit alpha [Candidatus Dormibacteraeota bacterium]|nr:Re/Si-specific NAD(P)(+) transhydrogenase subunit alpha [Candidatus Dormibacteraeota bacterium]
MATTLGVPREKGTGEKRVATVPAVLQSLTRIGLEVVVERGAGEAAGFLDEAYTSKGARVADRAEVLRCGIVAAVDAAALATEPDGPGQGAVLVGFCNPLTDREAVEGLARRGVATLSIELMPRITRAQSMDALSSQANLAGYKAVLIAAGMLPKIFPMLTTAAGTVAPARVLVVGAGVAGLQAIATARRLGAIVEAYDVRPAVKEQVESLGAKFVELPLEDSAAEDAGGYAKAQDESFYRRQQETMAKVVAASDVVITTALVPGRRAPVLVTAEMVAGMAPGSVIVDLAAEQGGNVEVTQPDKVVTAHNVSVVGAVNLPATVAQHASQMYAKNIATFLAHLVKDGTVTLDTEDQITRETLVTRDGRVVNARVCEALGIAAPAADAATA